MPPPIADQSAIDFVRDLPGPECGDERERGRVGHARPRARRGRGRPTSTRRWVRTPASRHAGIDSSTPSDQHHLAAVAVAERAEVQHRRRQTERVADRDQVEGGLRRVERLADVGQRDVGDREVQVGDRGDEDQREEDEGPAPGALSRSPPATGAVTLANPTGMVRNRASSVRGDARTRQRLEWPVVETRAHPRDNLVRRVRLLDELRATSGTPVVVIAGGAGAGKSTLVAQWTADDPARSRGSRSLRSTTTPRCSSPTWSGCSTSSSRSSRGRSSSCDRSRSTSRPCSSPASSGRWRNGDGPSSWSSTTPIASGPVAPGRSCRRWPTASPRAPNSWSWRARNPGWRWAGCAPIAGCAK